MAVGWLGEEAICVGMNISLGVSFKCVFVARLASFFPFKGGLWEGKGRGKGPISVRSADV